MKVLIIQDQMLTKGGSEKVFTYIADCFPKADLFTLSYNKDTSLAFSRSDDLNTSPIFNMLIRKHSAFKFFFPLLTYYFQFKNFKHYDLIITSSATVAKYIRKFDGKHICYCYVPTRAIWEVDNYFPKKTFIKKVFNIFLPWLKSRDLKTTNYIDFYIGDSNDCAKRIKKIYNKRSSYVYSPINYSFYKKYFSAQKEDYYLLVSRLDFWKRADIAIEAFNKNGKKLFIVGSGEAEQSLRKQSNKNITFLSSVSDLELGKLYSKARAVIFTPDIEHGLIPIEANACGTPAICYGFGGVLDTMIPYNGTNEDACTSVFFKEQTGDAINIAINEFEKLNLNHSFINKNAQKFSVEIFKNNLSTVVKQFLNNEEVLNEI